MDFLTSDGQKYSIEGGPFVEELSYDSDHAGQSMFSFDLPDYFGKFPSPKDEGFGVGQRVTIVCVVDQVRTDPTDPEAIRECGGYIKRVGFGQTCEIVGIEVDVNGYPGTDLDGTMLVKLPDGQLLIVLSDEVERV